jgi:hypothetical protein
LSPFLACPALSGSSLVTKVWRWENREGGLLKLAVKVGPLNLPAAKSAFQMHSSLACRRCLGILAEIGGLRQIQFDQVIGQVFYARNT